MKVTLTTNRLFAVEPKGMGNDLLKVILMHEWSWGGFIQFGIKCNFLSLLKSKRKPGLPPGKNSSSQAHLYLSFHASLGAYIYKVYNPHL